jgi:putative MATE family efflux protein
VFFFMISELCPEWVIGIYTADPAVQALGGDFLRVMAPSFLMISISFAYAVLLRSTGDVKTPLYTSIVGLGISAILGYLLVFGKFGLPEMGVNGAAWGINAGRLVEAVLLLWVIYHFKRPVAASIKEMLDFDSVFFKTIFTRAMPVALNETFWALGTTTFNIIYARIGTDAIAAVNIASTIETLAFVTFMGVSDGLGIIIGNKIGSGKKDEAYGFARRTYILVLIGAIAMGGMVYLFADDILKLYRVSPQVIEYALSILYVLSTVLWVKTSNMTMVVGILRSGGDTRFAFLLDTLSIWLIGVPLAFVGAFVFNLPVYWVYLMASSEEFVKFGISLARFKSRKWIYDLTEIGESSPVTNS